jgi:parallel beta-helix repeat protein
MRMAFRIGVLAFAMAVGVGEAATIIVPDDNPSLKDAVETAGPGDLIQVREGGYPGPINIENGQTGLTIQGIDPPATVTIITPVPSKYALRVKGVDGVTVNGISANGGRTGFILQDSGGSSFVNLFVFLGRKDAIYVRGGAANTVTGCTAASDGRGIRVDKSPVTVVSGNTLDFGSRKESIVVKRSDGATISGNSTTFGGRDGIRVIQSAGVTVDANVSSNNVRTGIRVQTSPGIAITNNTSDENALYGIRVQSSPPISTIADLTGAGNVASDNDVADFRVD